MRASQRPQLNGVCSGHGEEQGCALSPRDQPGEIRWGLVQEIGPHVPGNRAPWKFGEQE